MLPRSLQDHPFRIRPDQKVDLATFPTNDKELFPISKKRGRKLREEQDEQIDELQTRLYAEGKQRLLVAFQAMDAGGKDGAIRKVFRMMDPQGIRVVSFKQPSAIERAHDYLWRIHREVPRDGEVVIFNRTHYEDIIAVRAHEIFPERVWSKRYEHINNFERLLVDEGTTVLKFFLHISNEEQKERFQARLDNPEKNWKFNPRDLEDRAKWPKFMEIFTDILEKTSTEHAPWYVIPADRKWYRDLVIADILIKTLESLEIQYPAAHFDPQSFKIE